ncbi:MAG: putative Ig domain-containing protein, partial [Mycobacteriaceae bacterium]|nr:putative Ig domain-containing protein [Mycobacteriaceae bacterium]
KISITFNVDMKRGSARASDSVLNPANYTLVDSGGNAVIITAVDYDATSRIATLRFESPAADVYTVSVSKRLQSSASLELGADYVFSFTAVQDFSSLVDISFVATRSDRATGTVAFDVKVTNRTDYELRIPVMLVLDPARYFAGTPVGASLTGGLWFLDIGADLPSGILPPGGSTTVRTVTLTNPQAQHIEVGSGVYSVPYPNQPPKFTSAPLTDATAGTPYGYQASAQDPDGTVLSYVLMQGPADIALDGATGLLTWSPSAATAAKTPIVLRAYDSRGGYATQSFTITVAGGNRAPELDVPPSVRLFEGQPFSLDILGSDPDGNRLSYSVANLPPGANFNADLATLSWTPSGTQAGTYDNVLVSVTDGVNMTTTSLRMIVEPTNVAPVLQGIPDRTVRQGDPLRFTLHATDPDSTTLRFSSPNLPLGATLNPITGVFEWTPPYDKAGPAQIKFVVSDGSATGERTVVVNVVNVNAPPVFEQTDGISILEGQPLTLRLFAFDPDNPDYQPQVRLPDGTLTAPEATDPSVVYSIANLPAGATFDPVTCLLTWTPSYTQSGGYSLRITATDNGDGTGVSQSSTITAQVQVGNVNRAPVVPEFNAQTVASGQVLNLPIAVTDPDSNALALSFQNLPSYASFTDNGDGTGLLRIAP